MIKYNFVQINQSKLFNRVLSKFLPGEREIVERPASFSIRLKKEDLHIINRIILLPPHGFTADKINLLSPHPEARRAKIKILGKIKPENKGFAPVSKEVKFIFSLFREVPTKKILHILTTINFQLNIMESS